MIDRFIFIFFIYIIIDESAIQEAVQQLLRCNREKILKQYSEYVIYIRDSVMKKEVSVKTLVKYLLLLPGLKYHDDKDEHKALNGKREKLEQAEDIEDIFIVLDRECASFLNYEIFESIATRFKVNDDCDHLKYPEYLKDFVKKHTILQLAKIIPELESKYDSSKRNVTFKFDIEKTERFSKVTDLKFCIAKILGVNVLCFELVDVNVGSVIVTFLLPAHIADAIFSHDQVFTLKQVEELRALKIIWLKYGGKYLLNNLEDVSSGKAHLVHSHGLALYINNMMV